MNFQQNNKGDLLCEEELWASRKTSSREACKPMDAVATNQDGQKEDGKDLCDKKAVQLQVGSTCTSDTKVFLARLGIDILAYDIQEH